MSTAEARMGHFALLTQDEQHAAIHRLANSGFSEHGIAAATQLSAEFVRKILGDRTKAEAPAPT